MSIQGMYDESPLELDKMRRRAEIRQRLRFEYNRFVSNPLAPAYNMNLVHPQIERYGAARACRVDFIKYRWYHWLPLCGLLATAWFWTTINRKLAIEKKILESHQPPEWLYGRPPPRPDYLHMWYSRYWTMETGV